ncbi:MAG TPA: hypothetical protein VFA43_24445 [Gemmatimonadaceae bacterium]|nr:hypothetical protein [Gemmatimonadaceae bacterium]
MLPIRFVNTKDAQVHSATRVTTTHEVCEGLLRVDGEALVFQVLVTRTTTRVGGTSVETDRFTEPVRDIRVPISAIASIRIRRTGWLRRREVVIAARDLKAFIDLPGARAQELKIPVPREHADAAAELVGTVELAMADYALKLAESGGLPGLSAGS